MNSVRPRCPKEPGKAAGALPQALEAGLKGANLDSAPSSGYGYPEWGLSNIWAGRSPPKGSLSNVCFIRLGFDERSRRYWSWRFSIARLMIHSSGKFCHAAQWLILTGSSSKVQLHMPLPGTALLSVDEGSTKSCVS